ncbi:MAG TPA: hypothetical protein VMV21_03685 [Vicinamibacteria bacterium]|nr:hypothetical protein [Vicinamibacteria bacterium]
MTDSSDEPLQFDKAEFAQDGPSTAVCAYCQGPLRHSYYEVAAKAACLRCKDTIAAQGTQGSGVARFFRATAFGTGAGAVGAGLWYAVRAISNLEIGLIAILVGYMVGMAVRAGSHGRGGPLYQVLAVFLTYSAIVSTYVPLILGEVMKGGKAGATAGDAASPRAAVSSAKDEGAAVNADETNAEEASEGANAAEDLTPGRAFVAVTVFFLLVGAFAYAAPFLGGFENLIGLLIIGFGVWEAWKINRRITPDIAGPFRVAVAAAPPAASPSPPSPPPVAPSE